MRRVYEWTYLYSALEPSSGESFCMYLPGADGGCFEMFLEEVGKAYSDYHLLVVLDNAPSHTSKHISHPENVSLLSLPAYSPELNPVERWFLEFRRILSNKTFETIEVLQEALTNTLEPYWEDPTLLQRLTDYSWWVEAIEEALNTS